MGILLGESSRLGVEPLFGKKKRRDPSLSPLLRNTRRSPASDEFVRKVNKGIQSLPQTLQQAWVADRGKVRVGQFLTQIRPELKDNVPRGWDEWTTWDNSDAIASGKEVSLAEFSWASTDPRPSKFDAGANHSIQRGRTVSPPVTKPGNYLVETVNPAPLFRHEAGHSFDTLMGEALLDDAAEMSESEAFEDAYLSDVEKFSEKEKAIWYYQIQPDEEGNPTDGGYSEAFAESFASIYGGGCDKPKPFRKQFQNTVAFVEESIREFEQQRQKFNRVA